MLSNKNEVNRLNLVQKATHLKQNQLKVGKLQADWMLFVGMAGQKSQGGGIPL